MGYPPAHTQTEFGESAAALVPVKAFHLAKQRLAAALGPAERACLARSMATRVLQAARPLRVAVACDDPEVAEWADGLGADVVWTPGLGLNGAVARGVEWLEGQGAHRVLVVHADLPLARRLGRLCSFEGVTLVPDRRSDGTNALCVPAGSGIHFSYGPGSFRRHLDQAGQLGHPVRVLRPTELTLDVDIPDDLDKLVSATAHLGEGERLEALACVRR